MSPPAPFNKVNADRTSVNNDYQNQSVNPAFDEVHLYEVMYTLFYIDSYDRVILSFTLSFNMPLVESHFQRSDICHLCSL